MESLGKILSSIGDKIKKKNSTLAPEIQSFLNEKNSVTKSNSLARAYYRFNLVEKRIMESLISQLNPILSEEKQLQNLELKAIDYADIFEVSENHAYEHLKNSMQNLVKKVFSFSDDCQKIEFTLMSYAKYIEKEGKIICSFNPYIIHHLIGIRKNFTRYPLVNAVKFKSSYTWRLYEILVSWAKDTKKTQGRIEGWVTLKTKDFREMLGVPESYQWGHFQSQIIDIARKELLALLSIEIKIEIVSKKGKKIHSIKITFSQNVHV